MIESCRDIAILPEHVRVEALVRLYLACEPLPEVERRDLVAAMLDEESRLPTDELLAYTLGRLRAWLAIAESHPDLVRALAAAYDTSAPDLGTVSMRPVSAVQTVIHHQLTPDERGTLVRLLPDLGVE